MPAPSTLDNNLTTGGTNSQTLASWAAPYVTDMLAKSKAISEEGYKTYGGPLTAGSSNLQNKVFEGLGSLNFPSNLGKSFSSSGAYQLPQVGADGSISGNSGDPGIAGQYMNPYLMSVLGPQLDELRRQSQITQMGNNAKLTQAGAFGGSRQAIMDAETNRNLMQEQNKTVGQGYSNAFDKAMGQFNTEQNQAKTLADMMSQQGQTQRGIESEGIAADKAEFEKQRDYPKEQLKFQQSMLTGLPMSAVTNTPGSQTDLGNLLSILGGGMKLSEAGGYANVGDLIKGIYGGAKELFGQP